MILESVSLKYALLALIALLVERICVLCIKSSVKNKAKGQHFQCAPVW